MDHMDVERYGRNEMKTAIYVRVSTDKQEADNQTSVLKDFCINSKIEVFDVYCDIISGGEDSRPSYDKMFKDAHQKKFEMVLFWSLDRFSRSGTLFTLQKLHELELLGIGYKSYQEQYLDTAGQFKDVVISIMATVAKIEKTRISERTKAGLKCQCGHSRALHDKESKCQKCECLKFIRNGKRRGKDNPKKPRRRKGYFK